MFSSLLGPKPSKKTEPYSYSALPGQDDIRLIKMTSSWLGPYKYDIISTPLSKAPQFQTVSYCWGDPTFRHQLVLENNTHLPITDSLNKAIPKLSKLCTSGYLWIDQICINQNNPDERGQQVKMMADIYRTGCEVLIWLDSDATMDWRTRMLLELAKHATRKELEEFFRIPVILNDLSTLYKSPWFERRWVFQEYVLSPKASFVVGSLLVDARPFFRLTGIIGSSQGDFVRAHPGLGHFALMAGKRQMEQGREDGETPDPFYCFLQSMVIGPSLKSTDARDRVYAFLGFQQDKRIKIEPKYAQSVEAVLTDVARTIIEHTESLNIFGILATTVRSDKSVSALPSWVPDWTRATLEFRTIDWHEGNKSPIHFRAAQGRPHTLKSEGARLMVRGKVVDKVAFLSEKFSVKADDVWAMNLFEVLEVDSRLAKLGQAAGKPPLTRERFFRVLIADGAYRHESMLEWDDLPFKLDWDDTKQFIDHYYRFNPKQIPTPSPPKTIGDAYTTALQMCTDFASPRNFFQSEQGRLGMASKIQTGDVIAILHGCTTPVVLRPREAAGTFAFVATCYVEDIMYGDAVMWAEQDADELILE